MKSQHRNRQNLKKRRTCVDPKRIAAEKANCRQHRGSFDGRQPAAAVCKEN